MLVYERDIQPYLELESDGRPKARLRHAFYQASIDHRDRLRQVFGKAYPSYLNINRPKERDEYKLYRKSIYKNPLRSMRRRVIEVLDYVRQADDFAVSFPSDNRADAADSFESLVMSETYTKDGDALSWFFKHVRKAYVNDPNAVLVTLPLVQPVADTERAKPVPMLIPSEGVYQFRNGEFAVLESPERTWIQGPKGLEKTGKILLFLDGDSYCVARQIGRIEGNTTNGLVDQRLVWDILGATDEVNEAGEVVGFFFAPPLHLCPVMPAVKIGKLQEDSAEENARGEKLYVTPTTTVQPNDAGVEYYESILSDALPHIENAQALQSDIQVEANFHSASQEWRYAQKRCPDSHMAGGNCIDGRLVLRGTDGLPNPDGKTIACPTCKGSGHDVSGSGLGLIIVSAPTATSLGDEGRPTNLPTPPGGFIPRSIDPLREFVLEYEREKKQAYEVINMQFLMETPYQESGTSKRMDREELYRTLIVEGAHLCNLLRFLLESAACLRKQPTDAPDVLAPVRLSIENSELTRAELVEAVDKEFDSNLRKPLEKKLIGYQVGEDSDYYKRYELRERHDPFEELNFESKLFYLSAARLTMEAGSAELQELTEQIALSINFNGIVKSLLRDGDGFHNLEPKQQYEKLMEAARKLTGKLKKLDIDPTTGLPSLQEGQLVPIADLKNNNQLN